GGVASKVGAGYCFGGRPKGSSPAKVAPATGRFSSVRDEGVSRPSGTGRGCAGLRIQSPALQKGLPMIAIYKLGERDNWTCALCHKPVTRRSGMKPDSATRDHIVPRIRGGSDE